MPPSGVLLTRPRRGRAIGTEMTATPTIFRALETDHAPSASEGRSANRRTFEARDPVWLKTGAGITAHAGPSDVDRALGISSDGLPEIA